MREQWTPALIDREVNLEVRSALIRRYGEGRYLTESGHDVLHEDEYGTLLRKSFQGTREHLTMVRVLNSTEEPDGTRKVYYLRVPPGMRTAREAVAWTFGIPPSQYKPDKET